MRSNAARRTSEDLGRPGCQPSLPRVHLVIKIGLIADGAAGTRFDRDYRGGFFHPQRGENAGLQTLAPRPSVELLNDLAKDGEA